MKTILTFLGCMVVMTTHAQFQIAKTTTTPLIKLNDQLDSLDLIQKFGTPEQYYSRDDEGRSAHVNTYIYPDLSLRFIDYKLGSFTINNSNYMFFIHGAYQLRVGDRLDTFLQSIPPTEVDKRDYKDKVQLFFKSEDGTFFLDDSLNIRFDAAGVVTLFWWHSPI